MGTRDTRVDAYIAKSADFAKPILRQLRDTVHQACPAVEETMRWSAPHFMYHGMLCGMASFKEHCAFGFWKASLILAPDDNLGDAAMGHFGRIATLADLPSKKTLAGYVKKAMKLNKEGVKVERVKRKPKAPLAVPADSPARKESAATFENFRPSHRREYLEWLSEAQGEETRQRRLETAVGWMAEGKSRNWKYVR